MATIRKAPPSPQVVGGIAVVVVIAIVVAITTAAAIVIAVVIRPAIAIAIATQMGLEVIIDYRPFHLSFPLIQAFYEPCIVATKSFK